METRLWLHIAVGVLIQAPQYSQSVLLCEACSSKTYQLSFQTDLVGLELPLILDRKTFDLIELGLFGLKFQHNRAFKQNFKKRSIMETPSLD